MEADRSWLAEAWTFVRAHVPAAPAQRIVELGCGPLGGFVPMLRDLGQDAVGVDPHAPDGPHYAQVEFERYPAEIGDVVVASTSLHHVADLDAVLDKIRAVLAPGGHVVVVEWAWERVDEDTARWCFERLDADAEHGWLRATRDGWHDSGQSWSAYVTAWAASEGLHTSERIRSGLDERFAATATAVGPCYFPELAHTSAAEEKAAIEAGTIQAGATYFAGRAPIR